ncbi:MAG TPA: hypothetical protein VGM37_15010 [Armatimonadota bacterium]|jgi:hypothetical protein
MQLALQCVMSILFLFICFGAAHYALRYRAKRDKACIWEFCNLVVLGSVHGALLWQLFRMRFSDIPGELWLAVLLVTIVGPEMVSRKTGRGSFWGLETPIRLGKGRG